MNRIPAHEPMLVGVGASAGGLEAFLELLSAISDPSGIAIALVQHLDPNGRSLLAEVLARSTSLCIKEVDRSTDIEPATIYLCPPGRSMEVFGGRLQTNHLQSNHLQSNQGADDARQVASIDHFFHSIAQQQGERGVGVILSGAGSDGTMGLKAISDRGGLTFAQEPRSAKFDSMPRSAATTGVADHVMNPSEIGAELVSYRGHLMDLQAEPRGEDISESVPAIVEVLLNVTGHNFQHYKANTLVRRIRRRMQVLKIASPEDYLNHLRQSDDETRTLFRELLIGVTSFFRDPHAFESLQRKVLAELFRNRNAGDTVRIWVAGCASGPEAYTIAMLCRELMETVDDPPRVQIFATDIDERSLAIARAGSYPVGIADHVSPKRLKRFFVKRGKQYHVRKEIREIILFSAHNLISDPPFTRLDLISCRNLLIYLGPHLQNKLISLFHYSLRPAGYLFLGPSENVSSHGELFRPIDAQLRISQRKPTAIGSTTGLAFRNGGILDMTATETQPDAVVDLTAVAQRIALDEFLPPYVIVDEGAQIKNASPGVDRFIRLAEGDFKNDLLRMVQPGLRIGLRATLAEAIKVRRKVQHDNLSIRIGDQIQRVMLTVQPMPRLGEDESLFMVVFQDVGLPIHHEAAESLSMISGDAESIITHLEDELTTTRTDLDKSLQEMEVANEELKSSNEELLSMNEELQSANEELEASGEEIRASSDAVNRANSDLENLLRGTQIATVFLDDQYCIRSFTPAITEIYNLIPTDIGRPLSIFVPKADNVPPLPQPATADEAESDNVNSEVEHTITAHSGKYYLRRVLPYRTGNGERDGIVVTFADVTKLRESEELFELLVSASAQIVWMTDSDGRVISDSPSWRDYTGQTVRQWMGDGWLDAIHPDDRAATMDRWMRCIQTGSDFVWEYRLRHHSGNYRWTQVRGVPQRSGDGSIKRWVGMNIDIDDRKARELEQAEREMQVRRILDNSLALMAVLDLDGKVLEVNRSAADAINTPRDQIVGTDFCEVSWLTFDPQRQAQMRSIIQRAVAGETIREDLLYQAGDQIRAVDFSLSPIVDETGRIVSLVASGLDIEDRQTALVELEKAREEAQLANASKSEFLANMSHEIRTPMTAILGYADLLDGLDLKGEARDYLRTIRRNGDFLLEIINDILDLSKIEAGKLDISRELFNPARVVEDVRSIMNVRAEENDLDLNVRYDGKIPKQIDSDPKRLKQILINLVGNAIKFTNSGQVDVVVRHVDRDGDRLEFDVVDTGIGMSDEQKAKLFKPFSQGDSSVSRHFGGTGLGLAISRRLARMLGGNIRATSELGRGSTFTASIRTGSLEGIEFAEPKLVVPESDESQLPRRNSTDQIRLRCNVLVVDDRRDIRFLSKRILTSAGASVDEVEDGQLALDFVRQRLDKADPPDLILLDMQMPNLDGYQTSAALRGLGFAGPIIALTADAMQGDMNRCLEAGCNDYLSKPIDAGLLVSLVHQFTEA